MAQRALIRRPGPLLAEGIVTTIDRVRVDPDLALKQWEEYTDALSSNGWGLIEVPPLDDCPDAVFIEDAVVVFHMTDLFRDLAVVTRPGADARKPETEGLEPIIAAERYAVIHIEAPGTLDGGDVLKVGDVVYVGRGGRTNGEAIRQLRTALSPHGLTVIAVPVSKVLHLKSAVTALPDGTVIGYEPLVDDTRIFDRFRPVPEESGAHVVDLGEGRLLMAADCPRTADLFVDLGYEPVIVDIGEFEKLEGCVTCLSVRLRRP